MATQTLVDAPSSFPSATSPKDRLAIALDFPTAAQALAAVDRLNNTCRWFKVGMELFYAEGAPLIHTLRNRGFEIFLDLKLHDIPNTVAGAVSSVTATGASLLTLHAAGGERMMAAAAAALTAGSPRLLAVTVLTSMDVADLAATGVAAAPADQVLRLARLAQQSGIAGMVCSPLEVAALRAALAPDTMLVVPGIRPASTAGGNPDDQRRIATPAAAIRDGASLLVVGRPVTQASDPAAAAESILAEIADAESAAGYPAPRS
jgi:orotidine-5'-phosphate decarboxylase